MPTQVWASERPRRRSVARTFVPVVDDVIERLDRRAWPAVVSPLLVLVGLLYVFRWGPVVQHSASRWEAPSDLWRTFLASSEFAHGHFGAVYSTRLGFLALPGMLLLLSPLGALSGVLHTTAIQITNAPNPKVFLYATNQAYPDTIFTALQIGKGHPTQYWLHPQWFAPLMVAALVSSCTILFACDALAERLQVSRSRRAVLALLEAVLVFNVTVLWGHPEDALAVALAVYSFLAALDQRFSRSGWLFGAALAFQPLVIIVLPIILVMAGAARLAGFLLRAALPAAVLVVPSLIANFHETIHFTVVQPTYPNLADNHKTPIYPLAPSTGGKGAFLTVGGGPLRAVVLLLAGAFGLWTRRWRQRPELLAWAIALALALRVLGEPVMTSYYVWPALAVAVAVASRAHIVRFAAAAVLAVSVTVVAQWHLSEYWWWGLEVAGVAGVLAAAARPAPLDPDYQAERKRRVVPVAVSAPRAPDRSTSKKKQARKSASRARRQNARR